MVQVQEMPGIAEAKLKDGSRMPYADRLSSEADEDWRAEETFELERKARRVMIYLAAMTALSLALSIALIASLPADHASRYDARIVLLCVLAAILGSGTSAMVSAMNRIATGWEFSSGKKDPPDPRQRAPADDTREMFGGRLCAGFFVRPLLGAAMGFLIYVGLVGGGLILKGAQATDTANALRLAFIAFLAGLSAKSFLDKLRKVFSALF